MLLVQLKLKHTLIEVRAKVGERERGGKGKNVPNPLSTFCYLSAQRDAFSQLVHSQLTVEVALLGGVANLDNNYDGNHDCDEEEAHTVDDHLQIRVVGRRIVWDGYTWMETQG